MYNVGVGCLYPLLAVKCHLLVIKESAGGEAHAHGLPEPDVILHFGLTRHLGPYLVSTPEQAWDSDHHYHHHYHYHCHYLDRELLLTELCCWAWSAACLWASARAA